MDWKNIILKPLVFVFIDMPYFLTTQQSLLKKAAKNQYNFIDGFSATDSIWNHIEQPNCGKLRDINAQDKKGNTILHYLGGRYHFSEPWWIFLLSKGANANLPNNNGEVPLKFMAKHLNTSKYHLNKGFCVAKATSEEKLYPKELVLATSPENLNKVYADGETILTDIIKNNMFITPALIENLIKDGCDPHVPNKSGATPAQCFFNIIANSGWPPALLSWSSKYSTEILGNFCKETARYTEVISEVFFNAIQKKLISASPDFLNQYNVLIAHCHIPNILERDGFQRACFLGALLLEDTTRLPEMSFLLKKIASEELRLPFSGEKKQEIFSAVLNKIATLATDIDETDENGKTPLQSAIENNNTELAFILLQNGADVCTEDKEGNTLLHAAARANCAPVLAYLLSTGKLEKNAPNNKGETPLFLTKGHQECSLLLLRHISKINTPESKKFVFNFEELTSWQTAEMLISKSGVEVARKTKKLREAILYMNAQDRMRAYMHIQQQLTPKEKEDIESIIRSNPVKVNQRQPNRQPNQQHEKN